MGACHYYDGSRILSLLDLNGQKPEIYFVTSNRSAGKTTFFAKMLFKNFLKSRKQFLLLYRFTYELSDVPDKFFSGIQQMFFSAYEMTARKHCRGYIIELLVNEETCGYAVALNAADTVRKYSHLFSQVDAMFMDEFQSESGQYCKDEVSKFISVHTSVARGGGKQSRFVPVYLCSNSVSLLNPYFNALGISDRLKEDTKFLRGNGWVLEQNFNEYAAKALSESTFINAFSKCKYFQYSVQNIYLNDTKSFISLPPKTRSKYLATFTTENGNFALRSFPYEGLVYCSTHVDLSNPNKLVGCADSHQENYLLINSTSPFISQLRGLFEKGCFRFQNQRCKAECLKLLAYR